MAKPILDLSTFERPQIRINKKPYGLRHRGEISVMTKNRLESLMKQIRSLEALAVATHVQEQEYKDTLRSFVTVVVVDLPATVLQKLEVEHLVAIVSTFFIQLPPQTTAPQAGAKARQRTGASLSQN